MKNTEKLAAILRLVLNLPDGADVSNVRRINETKWDSLANATLVVAIEGEFGIKLDARDIERLTSFHATLLLVQEKTA